MICPACWAPARYGFQQWLAGGLGNGASIWKQTWLILAAATRTITPDHG
jgi:hypothetical protein